MKKTLLILLALAAGTTALRAQPDSLDYRGDYYFAKRAQQEREAVHARNIVMLGNSLTERGTWADILQDSLVLNRGIGGDCVAGMTARLGAIVAGTPRAIFLMAGVNDLIFSKITPEALLGQYERLLDAIRTASPRTTVFIQSLLPLDEPQNEAYFAGKNARIEAFNALLRETVRQRGLDYIDVWNRMARDGKMPAEYTVDGIHLNAAGYAVWSDVLRPYLPK